MELKRIRTWILVAALLLPATSAWGANSDPELRLSGIMMSRAGSSALINGRVVHAGDRVAHAEILSVDENSVRVRSEGMDFSLQVGSIERLDQVSSQIARKTPTPVIATATAPAPLPAPAPVAEESSTHIYYAASSSRTAPPSDAKIHQVKPGETLSGIAMHYFGRDESVLSRAMFKLFADNPMAFGDSMNVVYEGARLRVPLRSSLANVSAPLAAAEVARHVKRWKRKAASPVAARVTRVSITSEPEPTSRYGPVTSGETLSEIAQRLRPDDVTLNQMMIALYEANPQGFGGNINLIYEGVSLRIPEHQAIGRVPRHLATVQVERHDQAWRSDRAQPADPSKPDSLVSAVSSETLTAGL